MPMHAGSDAGLLATAEAMIADTAEEEVKFIRLL